MLLTIDANAADEIWFHPELPKDLRNELNSLSVKWSGPMRSERERVQKETERVQREIRRAELERENYTQQRRMVAILNRTMEGQIAMYQQLNTQLNRG
jgi:predicted RNase H-like nuclease (RuvC/YqgF family)